MRAIDLRSDTVTKPSPGMRRAMAEAEVGDDVYGEDPTVNRLQEVVAELLGFEAALFVPTGSMANQIAIKIHTRPGDNMLSGVGSHNYLYESGATVAVSGVQTTLIPGDGRFTAEDIEVHMHRDTADHHYAPTRLVSIENTHNVGGGVMWDLDEVRRILDAARRLELRTHLDGARLWNAAVAARVAVSELAAGFDTASVCLSKGLGAPVGSLICGSADLIHQAHRVRKMLGGAMRQVGILAAAGLFAIEHNRERLAEDHANAAWLGNAVGALPGLTVDVDSIETNIVMVDLAATVGTAAALAAKAEASGLRCTAFGPQRIRLVTHYDIDRTACERAVKLLAEAL